MGGEILIASCCGPQGLARLLAMLGFGQNGFRDDPTSSIRFHRILRRGREYGGELPPTDALAPAPSSEAERGLHFICLNANISRQFEFLQNAWTMNSKFSTLTGENDPVVGNREAIVGCPAHGSFTMPNDGRLRRRVAGLPPFVTVRGGAYFFLPGIRALRYFAGGRNVWALPGPDLHASCTTTRSITNSAGFNGATPTRTITRPSSMSS
jgi:hypothetical protein